MMRTRTGSDKRWINGGSHHLTSGWEVNIGPGLNIGGNASMTGVTSLRNGIISLP